MRRAVAGLAVVALATACSESPGTPADRSAHQSQATRATASATASESPSASATVTPYDGPIRFPLDATIPELQRAMRTGRITAVELVDFYLARIAAYDDAGPALNALITVNPDAREEAAALDAERAESGPRGPLHGIPVVLKDNIGTFDMPTTAGTPALRHFVPAEDAFQVRRLREAGAIIIAKANMAELAQSWSSTSTVGGQTLSPYDVTREPGGSSGGTAVAVTANFATVGFGTDTCGSNRLPAGLNNVYGLRPTSGLSSRSGVIPYSWTLDEVGPMARTVEDLAILLGATAGVDPDDPTTVPLTQSFVDAVTDDGLEGRRIGVPAFGFDADGDAPKDPPEWAVVEEEVLGALQRALAEMEAAGAELIDVPLPDFDPDVFLSLLGEQRFALRDYLSHQPTAPARAYRRILATALDPGQAEARLHTRIRQRALALRPAYRRELEALMERYDLDAFAHPVSPTTAGTLAEGAGHWNCAASALPGNPALVIPVGAGSDGLPVGLELLGRAFDETTLISIAAGYEAHTDHRMLPPTTPPLDAEP